MGGQDILAQPTLPFIRYRIPGRICPPEGNVDSSQSPSYQPCDALHLPCHVSLR